MLEETLNQQKFQTEEKIPIYITLFSLQSNYRR